MREEQKEKNREKNRKETNQRKKNRAEKDRKTTNQGKKNQTRITQKERNQKEKIQRRNNQTEKDRKESNQAKKSQEETNEDLNKQFHPAFCEAMLQIFEKEAGQYSFKKEHSLNTMPNRIDLLIIKKNAGEESGIGMGKLFRTYNIFEYKSPDQKLDEDEYHLAMAYAYLYSAYEKDVRPAEITLSFVREGEPRKLIRYFRDEGFEVTEYEPGICHVKKKGHMDIQIIVTRKLGKEYAWLKALTDKLTKEDALYLTEEAAKEADPEGIIRIRSIFDLVFQLNGQKKWMKEMIGMGALRDLYKVEFDREIQNLNEQLQSKDKQLQSKDEQLQSQTEQLHSKDEQLQSTNEENTKLRQEIERLKKQLQEQMGKIAMM